MFPSWIVVKLPRRKIFSCFSELVVGAPRFELGTSCAQGRRATRLRYAPTVTPSFILRQFPAFVLMAARLVRPVKWPSGSETFCSGALCRTAMEAGAGRGEFLPVL